MVVDLAQEATDTLSLAIPYTSLHDKFFFGSSRRAAGTRKLFLQNSLARYSSLIPHKVLLSLIIFTLLSSFLWGRRLYSHDNTN